jgi:16S rRNA (uracil1498-N3)-methyltransferase
LARRRFFVDHIHGGTARLTGDDAQHVKRVLRAEVGQRYEISDSQHAWLAEIVEARKDLVVFRTLEPVASPEAPVRITVLAALVKYDRFEWMVEKATELGVERIVPVEATRSEKGLFEAARKRVERWNRIARESSQQSRRLRPPEVTEAVRFDAALRDAAGHRYFLEEMAGTRPIVRALPAERPAEAEVSLLAGPEGGWTDSERERAAAAGWAPVSLGPQVLRAETAVMAAVAVVMNAWLTDALQ